MRTRIRILLNTDPKHCFLLTIKTKINICVLQGWGSRSSGQRCTATQCQSTAKVISQRFFTSRNRYAQCCGSKYRYIEFWSGSRSGSRVILSILKEKIKIILMKNISLKQNTGTGIFLSVNFHLKSYTFVPPYDPICIYRTCVDPGPYSEYGSGSR